MRCTHTSKNQGRGTTRTQVILHQENHLLYVEHFGAVPLPTFPHISAFAMVTPVFWRGGKNEGHQGQDLGDMGVPGLTQLLNY